MRAKRIVLATGALERPIVFAGNDRPGVMLASAARAYVERYAVVPGERAVVFTANDSGYAAALSLARAGVDVATIVDARGAPAEEVVTRARAAGIPVHLGEAVTSASGAERVTSVSIRSNDGSTTQVPCDIVAVSGGWNPAIHLWSHVKGTTRWHDAIAAFVPDRPAGPIEAAVPSPVRSRRATRSARASPRASMRRRWPGSRSAGRRRSRTSPRGCRGDPGPRS